MCLAIFVDVTTQLDDARRHGLAVAPLWETLTVYIASGLATLACSFLIIGALRLAPFRRGPIWRTVAVHLGGTLVFSLAHVALMVLLRSLVFAAMGVRPPFALSDLPYEYRKDLLAYVVIGGIFWLLRQRPNAAAETVVTTFDIREGAAILHAPVRDILAAKAAGNYVEFVLRDGRRPLMRAPMAAVEAALTPNGFLRTHRSWLVNAERVRALSPAGSGDFRLDLDCGLTVPLSRRYPKALARLRSEPS
jgi:DNA-binding LytR/AlgR family response regulator